MLRCKLRRWRLHTIADRCKPGDVAQALEFLNGNRRESRLLVVTQALGAVLHILGQLATDHDDTMTPITRLLDDAWQPFFAGHKGQAPQSQP